jgi:hypothetical protein
VGKDYISLGSGLRLLSEDEYAEEMGVTKRGFRALCKALQLPMLEIGNKRYVEMTSFSIAMRAVLTIGRPDFLTPGCETIRKNRRTNEATTLSTEEFEKSFEMAVLCLLASSDLNLKRSIYELKKAAGKVARRLTDAGVQFLPARAQADGKKKSDNQEG